MKIGILCTISNTFGRKGFYNVQEIGLGKALAAQGHSVIIYKSSMKETPEETVRLGKGLSIRYLHIPHLGVHGYLNCRKYLNPDLDAVFCFSDHQIFLPHVYRYCRKHGILFLPYLGTAGSQEEKSVHGKVMNLLYSIGTLRIYQKIPVYTKTEAVRQDLLRLGVPRVEVAPVGLDVTLLNADFREADKQALRQKFGYSEEDIVISVVGRLAAVKEPLKLLEIMRALKDRKEYQLLIVGEGDLREEMDSRIEEYGLEDRVQIIDRIPYENMWEIYTMADYFLNVNRHEIFGMAVMEAVYYETSVAAYPADGPTAILSGMEGHRLCRTLTDFTDWLTGEYPSKEALRRASDKIFREFTWNACAEKIIERILESKYEKDHH